MNHELPALNAGTPLAGICLMVGGMGATAATGIARWANATPTVAFAVDQTPGAAWANLAAMIGPTTTVAGIVATAYSWYWTRRTDRAKAQAEEARSRADTAKAEAEVKQAVRVERIAEEQAERDRILADALLAIQIHQAEIKARQEEHSSRFDQQDKAIATIAAVAAAVPTPTETK